MHFRYPWMLLCAAAMPLVALVWLYLKARATRRVARIAGLAAVPEGPGWAWQFFFAVAGLTLSMFAASRPQWGKSKIQIESLARNVVVAVDVSRSMLAEDLHPNRLERAKADVGDLIDSLQGDRCGLVAFRNSGELVCPLTTDRGFLRMALDGLSPASATAGPTDIGRAIRASLAALDPEMDGYNAIIVISDGGDLEGDALGAAKAAKERGVKIFTVGLGNPDADSTIPDPSGAGTMKFEDAEVKTRLENATLDAIARETGGRYVPLATAGMAETTLGAIYRRFLRQVAAKEQAEEEELRLTERYGIFLVPGILSLVAAGCLSKGRLKIG